MKKKTTNYKLTRNRLPRPLVASAFAPATIGNVSVGFDILGMAIKGVGDQVTLVKRPDSQIIIQSIRGCVDETIIPKAAEKNTATMALLSMQAGEKLKFGFDVYITKGIPLGSGMGGSAASAVAAVVAAQTFLKKKLNFEKQFFYALDGEKMASGAAHPDNVAPCLKGGLTLSSLAWNKPVIEVPFMKSMGWALIHPHITVETKQARKILSPTISVESWVAQSARLGSFISGFYKKDLALIKQGFADTIIEPQRAHLIPGFEEIKRKFSTLNQVLGFSISGSGPSVFILTTSLNAAQRVARQILKAFNDQGIQAEAYYGAGAAPGAQIIRAPKIAELSEVNRREV